MNVSTASIAKSSTVVRGQFDRLATDLRRSDEVLEQTVTNRQKIATSWGPHLYGLTDRLIQARDGLRDLQDARPEVTTLVDRLAVDVRTMASLGGALMLIAQRATILDSGWATVLDQSISNAREAIVLLMSVAPTVPAS